MWTTYWNLEPDTIKFKMTYQQKLWIC